MQKYMRISYAFMAEGLTDNIIEDNVVAERLNQKLQLFLDANKVKSYEIINTETSTISYKSTNHNYNLVSMHLAYEL